ncbi:MAG: hypothetical protein ACTTKY_00630 [Catonella sp.]
MRKRRRYKGYELLIDNDYIISGIRIMFPKQILYPHKWCEELNDWIDVSNVIKFDNLKKEYGTKYRMLDRSL